MKLSPSIRKINKSTDIYITFEVGNIFLKLQVCCNILLLHSSQALNMVSLVKYFVSKSSFLNEVSSTEEQDSIPVY